MKELNKEIVALVSKLGRAVTPEGSTEHITLRYLKELAIALEKTDDPRALESTVADLEHFWVSSVAWCSELSKDIERIIIIYRES
jgi:hypothetical protein